MSIIPVILFHTGFQGFSGGFIGVDVFFVISGYLITNILINELRSNKFSIINFYERRALRILPALFFVILTTSIASYFILLPADMENLLESIVATVFFSSNILFWLESGYFESEAELKPLLHTWSLAIEEQYYIVFPIYLLIAWRLGVKFTMISMIILVMVSLSIAHWGAYNRPVATFYLLPTRAWELMLGSLSACYAVCYNNRVNFVYCNIFSAIGLVFIILSIFIINHTTPFPSLYAVPATLGAVLVLLYSRKDTISYKILSYSPLVFIGLISYSLYLWHQPILALLKYEIYPSINDSHRFIAIVLVFMISVFSWRFIEQPFRKKQFRRKDVFKISAFCTLVFASFGVSGVWAKGFPHRMPEKHATLSDMNYYREEHWKDFSRYVNESGDMIERFEDLEKISILVIGNSWAHDIAYALAYEEGFSVAFEGRTGHKCEEFTLSMVAPGEREYSSWQKRCGGNKRRFEQIPIGTDVVVLADNVFREEQYSREEVYRAFVENVASIRRSFKGPIIVTKGRPAWKVGGYMIAARAPDMSEEHNVHIQGLLSTPIEKMSSISDYYQSFFEEYSIYYFSIIDIFCKDGKLCALMDDSGVFYFDSDHLTKLGARKISKGLAEFVRESINGELSK